MGHGHVGELARDRLCCYYVVFSSILISCIFGCDGYFSCEKDCRGWCYRDLEDYSRSTILDGPIKTRYIRFTLEGFSQERYYWYIGKVRSFMRIVLHAISIKIAYQGLITIETTDSYGE